MPLHEDTKLPLDFSDFEKNYNYAFEFNYNFPLFRLVKTLIRKRGKPVTVLDIGCGTGIGRNREMQHEIRILTDHYWGVEPDTDVDHEQGLFDRVAPTLLEDSDIPANSIDIAYAFMVMEHVENPEGFLKKVNEVLKPGGVFIFGSPNRHSFFGIMAVWTEKLKIADFLLSLIHTKDTLEHHYPLAYKINTAKDIRQHSEAAGLRARVAYCESPATLRTYFKGPLEIFRKLIVLKRRKIRSPKSLCHIYGYIEKPAEG